MALSISEALRDGLHAGLITEKDVEGNMWQALGDFITLVTPEIAVSNREACAVIADMTGSEDDARVAFHAQLRSVLTQAMEDTALHHDKIAVIASAAIATAQALVDLPINDDRVSRFFDIFGCLPKQYLEQFSV